MARIRKCKLSWQASTSEHVIGYKLYWAKGIDVDYDSKYLKLGNVTEIALPDDVTLSGGPVMFGVTAIDRDGNESDMVTLVKPYQLQVPEAPLDLSITPSDEFKLVDATGSQGEFASSVEPAQAVPGDDEESLAQAIEGDDADPPVKMKYYDDVGYRRTT
jgi:hypothetical protein